MSKLEQLINELCPKGVEYRKIGSILIRNTGTKITAQQMQQLHKENGKVRIFAGGRTFADVNYSDIPKNDINLNPSIIVKSRGNIGFEYYDKPFSHKNEFWSYCSEDEDVHIKFVYYYLSHNEGYFQQIGNTMQMPQISTSVTDNFKIPLPPLPIQYEIIRILDNFTELTAKLIAEIKAELTARKKQYEYYRNKLLTFGDDVPMVALGEIAEIGTGNSNTIDGLNEGAYPFYVRSQEVRYKNSYEFDETATITSGDGVGVGKIFHYVEGKYALHQRAYRLHIIDDRVLPRFYHHYMKATFWDYITMSAYHASVTSIRRPMLEKYPVPLLPLAEQARIVAILDRFDTLTTDILSGLPAEIAARQKQYEHYRDRLLTFKEAT